MEYVDEKTINLKYTINKISSREGVTKLDLQNHGLETFPINLFATPKVFDKITHIDLSNNKLAELPQYPEGTVINNCRTDGEV